MSGERALRKRGLCAWLIVAGGGAAAWWWHQPAEPADMAEERLAADRAAGHGTAANAVLVDLRDDVGNEDVVRLGRQHFVELVPVSTQSKDERLFRIAVDPGSRDALVEALRADPAVDRAEPDSLLRVDADPGVEVEGGYALGYPNDPKFEYQWHLQQIDMASAWYLGDGEGVVVAVLDTGVALEKAAGFARAEDLRVRFVKPYDFVDDDAHPNDLHGHGTHAAGTIAEATDNGIGAAGIAPRVRIMPLRIADPTGVASAGTVADAIYYAVDEGAEIVYLGVAGRYPSGIVHSALDYAYSKGVVVVCPAGNDGAERVAYPGAYPTTIAVGATQLDGTRARYSNRGPRLDVLAPGGNTQLDQNGDGVPDGIVQNTIARADPAQNRYLAMQGSGLSAAHVTGVAALLIGEGVSSPASVKRLIVTSARAGESGVGSIDAGAALLKVRFEVGAWQLGLGLLVAISLAFSVRRKVSFFGFPLGVLIGASGFFFLPYFAPEASSLVGVEELTRGLPSIGAGSMGALYANPVLLSVAPALLLVVLLLRVPGTRSLLAGICAGVAGHLLFFAVTSMVDVLWMPTDVVWLVGNAALAAGLGALVLARQA